MSGPRVCALLSLGLVLLLSAVLSWRAALPANRDRGGMDYVVLETNAQSYYVPRNANGYEDVVTQVTARNFARDGFGRTHLLPNRGGAPNVSLYDQSGTQCERLVERTDVLTYENVFSQRRPMFSLNGDCIYTHYPPLADWVFGLLAALGLHRVLYYKLLSILLNGGFLLVTYRWLCREVRPEAALVATALGGTCPAFLQWADTLYYHSFHYLFLMCGVLAWSRYLDRPRRSWFVLTFAIYFCEALVSYQLTLFFGIALAGLLVLAWHEAGLRTWLELLSLQAVAPVAAFLFHFGLSSTLIGLGSAWHNLWKTLPDRVGGGYPGGLQGVLQGIHEGLLPSSLLLFGLALVIVVRRASRAPLRRPLALLALFLAGGISFMVALPGTTSWHGWMMYRQVMPAVILLLAFVADALFSARELVKSAGAAQASSKRPVQTLALLCLVLGCLHLGWVGYRNGARIRGEIALILAKNSSYDETNLVWRSLDVVYWGEGTEPPKGILYMPVSGLEVNEPPAWMIDFRMRGPGASHYEIWWLEEEAMKTVRLLVDRAQASAITKQCSVEFFDGKVFEPMSEDVRSRAEALLSAEAEAPQGKPYTWLYFSRSAPLRSRAARLTCSGLDEVTLRRIQVFSI